MTRTISIDRARRLALAAQGFSRSRPARVDVRHFRRVLADVGLVQLDSVNVAARAHYMPFFSRLGDYSTDSLDRWIWRSGELFEYWGHEASVLPIGDWPLMGHRMRGVEPGHRIRELMDAHPGFLEDVLAEVHAVGPLATSDLSDGGERTGPWWGWGRGKLALEWHFLTGAVSIVDRPNFTKVYDVVGRVIPDHVLAADDVDASAARRTLLRRSVRHHGIGTVADLADYYRIKPAQARPLLADLAARGQISEVEVPGWKGPVYLDPELPVPRTVTGRALLAPFDPLVWFRDRVERLFGFHYRIEIYVPAPKRVYGYYVFPFLLDDRLVARVDLKADRAAGRLLVRGAFVEASEDPVRVASELAVELHAMAGWMGLGDVTISDNGDLASQLARCV